MSFNQDLSLYKNIQIRLFNKNQTFKNLADVLETTEGSLKTRIGAKFIRNGHSTPLDIKIFNYLSKNIEGFSKYCKQHNITLVS